MTVPQDNGSSALQTALAYFDAWTSQDFGRAMRLISPQIICHAPAGDLVGAEAFRGFMEPFSGIVTRASLLAAFGDDHSAMLMYDTQTVPVPDAPGAELHTVVDGTITEIKIVFDRTPFQAARERAG